MTEFPSNLQHLNTFLNCTGTFYLWKYNEQMELLDATCSSEKLQKLFDISGCKDFLKNYMQEKTAPLILWSPMGILWIAAFEKSEQTDHAICCYIIGPLNSAEASLSDKRTELTRLNISSELKLELKRIAKKLPMMSILSLYPYTQMLHFAVTNTPITRSEIAFQETSKEQKNLSETKPPSDRHLLWMNEQLLLSHIKNGDLNYQKDLDRITEISTGIRMENTDMLTRGKYSVSTFISLCSRAAIEGGLSPEEAYLCGDTYLTKLMHCTSIGDIKALNHEIYDTFIHKVHALKKNRSYSKEIQHCCDYIHLHVDDAFSLKKLADKLGYNEYYLTRKFKKETGITLVDYIKKTKIEYAKQQLAYSDQSISDISNMLHFSSRSYFSEVFRQLVGIPPAEYRKREQRL